MSERETPEEDRLAELMGALAGRDPLRPLSVGWLRRRQARRQRLLVLASVVATVTVAGAASAATLAVRGDAAREVTRPVPVTSPSRTPDVLPRPSRSGPSAAATAPATAPATVLAAPAVAKDVTDLVARHRVVLFRRCDRFLVCTSRTQLVSADGTVLHPSQAAPQLDRLVATGGHELLGWANGTPGLYRSEDDGAMWSHELLPGVVSSDSPVLLSDVLVLGSSVWLLIDDCDGAPCNGLLRAGQAGEDPRSYRDLPLPMREQASSMARGMVTLSSTGSRSLPARAAVFIDDAGTGRVWTSADDGRTWHANASPCRTGYPGPVGIGDDGSVLLVCVGEETAGAEPKQLAVARITGTGATRGWTYRALPPSGYADQVVGLAGGGALVAGQRGPVYEAGRPMPLTDTGDGFRLSPDGAFAAGYADEGAHDSGYAALFRPTAGGRPWMPLRVGD